MATGNGAPCSISTAMVIGIKANTEPTERSNSPLIIRMVTPMATSPVSGQDAEHAAQIVLIQEHAVRTDLEDDHQQHKQDQACQFRLFEIGLEQAFHGSSARLKLGRAWRPQGPPGEAAVSASPARKAP